MSAIQKLDRRSFLKAGAAATGGLALGSRTSEPALRRARKRGGPLGPPRETEGQATG